MKRIFSLIMIASAGLLGAPANADLVHRLTTSTQLSVDGAATQATRLGSTYSVSGNNIKVSDSATFGGITKSSTAAAATQTQGTYELNTNGSAFSFSESFIGGTL